MNVSETQEELRLIDLVQERTGLDFSAAKSLLHGANWDLVEALEHFASERPNSGTKSQGSWDRILRVVKEGSATQVRVKRDGNVVAELPAPAGLAGVILAPKLAVIGAAACMLAGCTLEFERRSDGSGAR